MDKSDAQGYIQQGFNLKDSGNFVQAAEAFSRAIEADPSSILAYSYRGYCFAQDDHVQLALADFTEVMRLDPSYGEAYVNRAALYFDLERYPEAWKDLEQALGLDPENPVIHHLRGELWYVDGDLDQAASCFEQALSCDPHFDDSRERLLEVYREPKIWWIFNQLSYSIGNIMKGRSGAHSGQITKDSVNNHVDQMIKIFTSSSSGRTDRDHSVIFQDIDLEECAYALRSLGLILTVNQDGPPWNGLAWLKSLGSDDC